MKLTLKKSVSLLLAVIMVVSGFATIPLVTSAGNDYTINSTTSTDDYYNLISKKDWDIAPGITESEIVLNNDDGSRRQVLFVMEADLNNEYVKVINSYNGMIPQYGDYKVGVMSQQAAYAEANGYGNVVGAMNTTLSWYTGYPSDRVGEPLGFIMLDAEILFDPANCGYVYGNVGFPSVVVINKDFDENGNPRPADIPKVEMPQIRSAADLDGWEEQVIPASSGYIVKDGVNQAKPDHTSSSAPRSVVGIKPDGTVVIMLNDGRQAPYSTGMTMYELAEVMLDLGCSFAVNCDGGGSSTYLSQRPGEELKVNNSPSDGAERDTTTGILFISTAPATGEFVRANISSEYDYYTPGSVVEFTALGTDLVGTEAEIPADAEWQLADDSFGTIENGVFTSNGKEGAVTAQLIYNGEVVGEDIINIVMPDVVEFAQNNMVIPFGKEVQIVINATYDSKPVCIKESDVEFELSNPVLGSLDGFTFSSAPEGTVAEPGTLTAKIGDITIVANIALGKGTEIAYDFEDQNLEGWSIISNYLQYGPTGPNGSLKDPNGNYWYNGQNELGYISIVDSTTGKVKNGEYAFAMECDFTQIYETGFHSLNMRFPKIDTTDAVSVGFWIYVPYDARHSDLTINSVLGEKFFADGSAMELCEGWHYVKLNAPSAADGFYGISISVDERASGKDANGNNYYDNVTTPNLNGKYTFYIDDISVDYSTAVEDRENPVFSDPMVMDAVGSVNAKINGQTINFNNPTFEVKVADFVADNATGLNASSAKAYIDGKEVDCTFANGKIAINGLNLADGVHSVKFEISDNAGNSSWVGGKINVAAGTKAAGVTVAPRNPEADRLLIGSVYWMDVTAANIEKVEKIEMIFDLNNASNWALEGLTTAPGFTADWSVQEDDNIATITITRTGKVTAAGNAVVASIPVRTWESHITEYPGYENQTPATLVKRGIIWAQSIELALEKGVVTYTDNTVDTFGMNDLLVDTEIFFTNYTRKSVEGAQAWIDAKKAAGVGFHEHTAVALDDKAATCTENGYSGRTFCSVCESVVEWGVSIPATGHDFSTVTGTNLVCHCGAKFSADGFVEINGNLMYFTGENFSTGVNRIGAKYYNFDKNGAAYDGIINICGTDCLFDKGISVETDTVLYAGSCGEDAVYVIHQDGSMIVGGSGAITDFTNIGLVPWNSDYRYDIFSLFIGKDITSIGAVAFRSIVNLKTVTFEEGSKLESINRIAFSYCYDLEEVILPESLTTIKGSAFLNCTSLKYVYIPTGTTTIASDAFTSCSDELTLDVAENSVAYRLAVSKGYNYITRVVEVASGTCGDTNWNLTSDGILTINGSGKIADNDAGKAPWYSYAKQIKKIVIGKDVTYIGKFNFKDLKAVTEVVFEKDSKLETIGWGAFGSCAALKTITIPATVKTIDGYAFYYAGLEAVAFEENSQLSSIGAHAFWNCPTIENFFVPDKVINIGTNAFLGCIGTATFNVARGTYGHDYFKNYNVVVRDPILYTIASGVCGAADWSLTSDGTLAINGNGAMADNDASKAPWQKYANLVRKVVIGKDITYIGKFNFKDLKSCTEVVFEAGAKLETIGWGAFGFCTSLKEITIPATVKTIDGYAFYYAGLETVAFEENSKLSSIGAHAFWNCPTIKNFFVPDKLINIGTNAFLGCIGTATFDVAYGTYGHDYFGNYNVTVREPILYTIASGTCGDTEWTLTSNGALTISGSGKMADNDASKAPWQSYAKLVRKIVIGKDVTYIGKFNFKDLKSVTEVVFETGTKLEAIGWGAFGFCSSLKEITIPATVKTIDGYAFYYSGLEAVAFEEGSALESIGAHAFWNCPAIENFFVPDKLINIGTNAFLGCIGTATFNVARGTYAHDYFKNYNVVVRDPIIYTIADGICGETEWTLTSDGALTISGSGAMADNAASQSPWQSYAKLIKKIVIGKDVTYVGQFNFKDLKAVTEVVFEEGAKLETIGWGAFGFCSSLKEITIPATVKTIEKYAFYYCSSLKTVAFADGSALKTIKACAFLNDTALVSVAYPAGTSVASDAFAGCPNYKK